VLKLALALSILTVACGAGTATSPTPAAVAAAAGQAPSPCMVGDPVVNPAGPSIDIRLCDAVTDMTVDENGAPLLTSMHTFTDDAIGRAAAKASALYWRIDVHFSARYVVHVLYKGTWFTLQEIPVGPQNPCGDREHPCGDAPVAPSPTSTPATCSLGAIDVHGPDISANAATFTLAIKPGYSGHVTVHLTTYGSTARDLAYPLTKAHVQDPPITLEAGTPQPVSIHLTRDYGDLYPSWAVYLTCEPLPDPLLAAPAGALSSTVGRL
jgi:hypothetical protein